MAPRTERGSCVHQGLNLNDPDARMEMAHSYSTELLRFLRHRVGSTDDASDLCQETFVRMARSSPAPIENLRAYVFRVARNLSEDFLRSERRRNGYIVADVHEGLAADQPCPEQAAFSKREIKRLRSALASLPERQRVALLLYRLEGLPLREIAARLNVSESMASRYVAAALRHCEAKLGR